jgi:hypothetical protein
MSAVQSTLFDRELITGACSGSACAAAGDRPRRRRGRAATDPVVFSWTASCVNPTGRRKLSFYYRPLRRHRSRPAGENRSAEQLACELIKEYFVAVGGFCVVTSAIMRAWGDLLLAPGVKPGTAPRFTPDQISQAIRVKADAQRGKTVDETARKRAFLGRPATFAARVGYWVDLAQRQARARASADSNDRLRDRLNQLCRPVEGPQPAPARQIAPAFARPRETLQGVLRRHVREAREQLDFNTRVWRATRPDLRGLVERALRTDFVEYVQTFDPTADPRDAWLRPLWLSWCAIESIRRYGDDVLAPPADETVQWPVGRTGMLFQTAANGVGTPAVADSDAVANAFR